MWQVLASYDIARHARNWLLHLNGNSNWIRGDQGKKLGIRLQVKQLVQVELLHLSVVGIGLVLQARRGQACLAHICQRHFVIWKRIQSGFLVVYSLKIRCGLYVESRENFAAIEEGVHENYSCRPCRIVV